MIDRRPTKAINRAECIPQTESSLWKVNKRGRGELLRKVSRFEDFRLQIIIYPTPGLPHAQNSNQTSFSFKRGSAEELVGQWRFENAFDIPALADMAFSQ